MEAIRAERLTKFYGKTRGIDGLDLSVMQGDFFGFIGPNGAGKSTLIRTLLGLVSPTGGYAWVFGKDTVKYSKDILKDVGYLPSEAVFYSGMKVKDVLKLSADLRKVDCTEESRVLCDRLQLDVNKKTEELSYGNRKKVAIVCALQHKPKLLLLDEPTGGLDPLMQKEFFSILKERNAQGATVFLSSHVLSEVQHNCTRAAIINDGRIIACDTIDKLSETSAKRVTVHGSVDIKKLNGVCGLNNTGDTQSFLYSGDVKSLLSVLSEGQISDFTVTEPDFEEIFLHYYEKDGDKV